MTVAAIIEDIPYALKMTTAHYIHKTNRRKRLSMIYGRWLIRLISKLVSTNGEQPLLRDIEMDCLASNVAVP